MQHNREMDKVAGIGGLVFRARDPLSSRRSRKRPTTLARTAPWMVNLRALGVSVEIDPQPYPNGRFARLYDPEGNAIELWEPGGRDAP